MGGPYQGEDQTTLETIDKEEAIRQFQHVFNESRGRELIGTANPALVENLFKGQSKRWTMVATDYVNKMINLCHVFARQCLRDACGDDIAATLLRLYVDKDLRDRQKKARDELKNLLSDHDTYVQTFNPRFISQSQSRSVPLFRALRKFSTQAPWECGVTMRSHELLLSLRRRPPVDQGSRN